MRSGASSGAAADRSRSGPKNPRGGLRAVAAALGLDAAARDAGGHPRLFAPPELELLSSTPWPSARDAFTGRDSFWLEGLIRAVMEIRGCDADEAARDRRRSGSGEGLDHAPRSTASSRSGSASACWWTRRRPTRSIPAMLQRAEEGFEEPLYIHLLRHPLGMIRSFEEAKLDQIFFRRPHPFARRELAELIWLVSHRNILSFLAGVPARAPAPGALRGAGARAGGGAARASASFLGLDFDPAMARALRARASRA